MAIDSSAAMPPFAISRDVAWRHGLPELRDEFVRLRELTDADAESLALHLSSDAVNAHMAACPSTALKFRRFITWARDERRRGSLVCYGIVPHGETGAVGIIQFWPVERDFFTAEWGFVLGDSFWGTGVFMRAATLAVEFAFAELAVHRLEARAVDTNARGNRVLEKLGAQRDGVLRGGFRDGDRVRDHVMWSILAPEWRARRRVANG
jgi:RimJ/RimL family protein N-acetyltransferase